MDFNTPEDSDVKYRRNQTIKHVYHTTFFFTIPLPKQTKRVVITTKNTGKTTSLRERGEVRHAPIQHVVYSPPPETRAKLPPRVSASPEIPQKPLTETEGTRA